MSMKINGFDMSEPVDIYVSQADALTPFGEVQDWTPFNESSVLIRSSPWARDLFVPLLVIKIRRSRQRVRDWSLRSFFLTRPELVLRDHTVDLLATPAPKNVFQMLVSGVWSGDKVTPVWKWYPRCHMSSHVVSNAGVANEITFVAAYCNREIGFGLSKIVGDWETEEGYEQDGIQFWMTETR